MACSGLPTGLEISLLVECRSQTGDIDCHVERFYVKTAASMIEMNSTGEEPEYKFNLECPTILVMERKQFLPD